MEEVNEMQERNPPPVVGQCARGILFLCYGCRESTRMKENEPNVGD